jgi:hypothetical protein
MANRKQKSLFTSLLLGVPFRIKLSVAQQSYRNRRRIAFPSEVLLPKSQCANVTKNPNFTPGVLRAINSYRRPGRMRETA